MSVTGLSAPDPRDDVLVQAGRDAFAPVYPQKMAVAVSGGGDSMALLHVLAQLAPACGFSLEAVTVDHGLRAAAVDEAAFVAQACAALGVPHHVLRWEGWNGAGNVMAAARDARYQLIAKWAAAHDITAVALGHTRDDIAENFLIRLARKSGPDGLAAMQPRFDRYGMAWGRPFWQQSRVDLRDYLQRHDVAWVEDPTNEDDAFDRVRARNALPALDALGISGDALAAVSQSMRKASDALNHYAGIESRRYIVQQEGDLVLRLGLTGPLPDEIKRRLWRAALPWINGAAYPPRQSAVSEVLAGLTHDGNATVGGCLIVRKGDDWRVTREFAAVRDIVSPTTALWDGRWRLDGPHDPGLDVRALGEAVRDCPDWRSVGLPRTSLISTPAIWRGDTCIAAPMAGFANGWVAQIVADFHEHAFAH